MTRKQLNKMTGTSALPDLWHFGEGGTLGARNRGEGLFDAEVTATTDQLDRLPAPLPDSCTLCGVPTEGLAMCDQCLDATGVTS